MCAILLVAVGIVIYWIFMYDTWYPNSVTIDTDSSEGTHGSFVPDIGVDSES